MAGLPEVPGLQGMLMRTPSARRREESEGIVKSVIILYILTGFVVIQENVKPSLK